MTNPSTKGALERLADLADWLTDRSRSETVPYLNDSISADLRTLLSALSEAEKALDWAEEALGDYACYTPDARCIRTPDQCRNECGRPAGDALIVVSAALSKLRGEG